MMDRELTAYCADIWPRLVGGLALHCGDQGIAEELAQETLVRVWQHWPRINARATRDAWVWKVAMNLSKSRWRRRYAERRALDRIDHAAAQSPVAVADQIAVRDALAQLPDRQRTAVVLRYYADLPVKDVAQAMDCAEGTVGAHTHKALARLNELLDEDDEVITNA